MSSSRTITILDGGMGHLLRRHGIEIKGKIGSLSRFSEVALANLDNPSLVEQCHREYLDAGAQVIITNNYGCVPSIIETTKSPTKSYDEETWSTVNRLINASGKKAKDAKLAHFNRENIKVAGSLPPLRESYRFDLVPDDEELEDSYNKIVNEIQNYSDILLCETMSSVREAKAAATAANSVGKPVWVSWTLHEDASGNLRSSESIESAVEALASINNLEACLFNCCSHQSVCAAIPKLKEALDSMGKKNVEIGVYANGFKTVEAKTSNDEKSEYLDFGVTDYLMQAKIWTDLGATVVGGCCGVFPEHIKELSSHFKQE